MRKVTVLAAVALLFALGGLVIGTENAWGYQGAAQVCRDFKDFDQPSEGACVSYLQRLFNAGNPDVVLLCQDPVISSPFRNQGECVRTLQRYAFP